MSFAADWLELRAPADDAARDPALLAAAGAFLAARGPAPLVVDLGAGTGASLRALAPHAPPGARFRLVDHDPGLLARAAARHPGAETRAADLSGPLAPLLAGADLVTASAFFDLASAAFVARLIDALPRDAAVYAALSYDGREVWRPEPEGAAAVRRAFLTDQRRDKGLGPALGPGASGALAAALDASGRAPRRAPSPWRLERARDGALIDALAGGIADAAAAHGVEVGPWRAARFESCEIGHEDLFAAPG